MPKILIAECKQEVSTFNPQLSHYADFDISTGDDILNVHRGLPTEMGGVLAVFEAEPDIELVPAYSARSITSGGTLGAADFRRMADEFLAAVRAAPAVDGVYFSLHGAMASEDEFDPEGYLLAETRKIVGEQVPLVASFDLHGIMTDQILQHCDAITAFHTYPHVDFYDTGVRAARLLLRIMAGEVKPIIAKVEIPALVRGDELITATGLFGQSIRATQAIEQMPGGLAAGMFIGNPFTDVPELRSNSFVITDNDPVTAERAALKLAADFWEVRERLQSALVSLEAAVDVAMRTTDVTVIFTDAADATSSGASGDSNALLRALREAGYTGRTLIPIVDPLAVEAAFRAGVGAQVETTVGGQIDPRYEPLPITATVRLLSDGDFINESHGSVWHAGNTAVLESGNDTLVVTSRAVSLYDRSLFLAHGQNPQHFDLVVVKSPHCQPHFFTEWAVVNLNVDAPGSTSANLRSLGHTRCARPVFPLDENITYTPQAKRFQR
ncbi:MAG: microcystin degradation protein MlrC [Anaerolineaceae bacterium]|nr:microcystin degradation protein MlrC [Anaerolineaceae bacterium]